MTLLNSFGDFAGLTISTDPAALTFGPGKAAADLQGGDVPMVMTYAASVAKTNAPWIQGAGGLMDSSTPVPSNPWVHLYAIGRTDTGASDIIGSYKYPAVGPILPSGWTCSRWFNARLLDGSGNWVPMLQYGDRNEWANTWLDVNEIRLGTSAQSVFLPHVPPGVVTRAIIIPETAGSGSGISEIGVWNPAVTSIQPGTADGAAVAMDYSGGNSGGSAELVKVTNAAQQIILRGNNQNSGSNYASVRVLGFEVIL